MGELRAQVELGWGNAYHHLRKLERAGLIRTRRIGRRFVIVPRSGVVDEMEVHARAILRGGTALRVCSDIANHPGTDVTHIATRLDETTRAVYYHVGRLTGCGLVVSKSPARQFALHVTPLFERIDATVQ